MDRKERFLSYVNKNGRGGCWEWTGGCSKVGYGNFRWGGGERIQYNSHRAAWMIFVGPIPEGVWVLHTCDNRKCVNPDHLYLGDRYDNYKDMVDRKRSRNGNRPLDDEWIGEINRLWADGMAKNAIARHFNASINTVRKALNAHQNN